MNDEITNSKILIVGGSSGIGLAVAKHACKRAARVLIASRNPSVAELPEGSVELRTLDITSSSDRNRLFEDIGTIDHLVIAVRPEADSVPFLSIDAANARKAFETKFWGAYQLIQVAYSHLRESGSITLTSGIAGEKIYRGASTMALINSATETLCRTLAVELAPLRVNVVSPGFIEPKPESLQKIASQFPSQRLASLDEVASVYISVMANPYVTGSVTVVDGGARLV